MENALECCTCPTPFAMRIAAIVNGADPLVHLPQGPLQGIKVFTSEQRQINAYLGIPYARAPKGELRFAPPERHPGWEGLLMAGTAAPSCPQPSDPISKDQLSQDEDCLYLNVWAPDISSIRKLPVVIFLEGEDFVTGSGNRFSGQELSSEGGTVVVTLNYRLNVFGFLCFGDSRSRGNMGLLDQYMALLWVRENIGYFGGDNGSITLMGHGAGAASVVYHMTSPRTLGLFHRAILMSGSITSPWLSVRPQGPSSRSIARSLGCFEKSSADLLRCLRAKNSAELIRAFQEQYNNGNWTDLVAPVVDSFLPNRDQYLPKNPVEALASGDHLRIPILTGITSNEGALVLYQWNELIRESFTYLRRFFIESALPLTLSRYGYNSSFGEYGEYLELIQWMYMHDIHGGDTSRLVVKLMQLFSDAQFNAPHAKQLALFAASAGDLSSPSFPIYVYRFDHTDGPDPYGSTIPVQGAIHGSDLLYIFGLRKTGNRYPNPQTQLSKRMRRLWNSFIKFGNPTLLNDTYGSFWAPYTSQRQETFRLQPDIHMVTGRDPWDDPHGLAERVSLWNDLLPKLMEIHTNRTPIYVSPEIREYTDSSGPLRSAMYTLIAFVAVLLVLLVVCLVLLRRRNRELDHAELF